MKKLLFLLCAVTFLLSCQNKKQEEAKIETEIYDIKYAKVFKVKKYEDYTQITVNNPWDSTRVLQSYILVDKEKSLPTKLPEGTLVRTPVQSLALYSTVHCAVLGEMNSLQLIKAVCEPEYIDLQYVKDGVANNTIANIGQASNPDIEKLIDVNIDAIITSPIQGMPYGGIEKTGIPLIEAPDYMETTPLGRAEWIKFYALFVGKEAMADSLFKAVEKEYNELKDKIATTTNRPTVFADLKFGNSWYIAGGESFIGNFLKDAGANYIWAADKSSGANPQTFETVLDKAGEADIWLIKYNNPTDMTYADLEKEYKGYSYFKAFKDKNIYVCHTGKVPYYEVVAIHPEKILKDFAYIFHPELYSGYEPQFYKKMIK